MASNMRLTPRQKELLGQIDKDPFTEYAKRDRWGRPEIDGQPHRRPSSIAKALDDANGLVRWKSKMTALGATKAPFVLDQLKALDADDPNNRYVVGDLVEELAVAGGASDGADYGALIHGLLEMEDRKPLPFRWPYDDELLAEVQGDEHFAAILANYQAKNAELGFEVVPEWVEVPLIVGSMKAAGTCDRLVRLPNGDVCVYDLKTGEGNPFRAKFLGWATQLHCYSQADAIYDPETDERSPLPEGFNPDVGFICHIDRSSTEVDVYRIDLRRGAEMIELAQAVEEARSVAVQWASKVDKPLPAGQTDGDVIAGRIAVLRDADGFGLDQLMGLWQAAGLPAPRDLTPQHWPEALRVTDEALTMASIVPPSMAEAEQRLANLPTDLRNGVEAHSKWCDRSISEQDTEAALLQAGIDLDIAETALEQRKAIVQAAAGKIPTEVRPAFRSWLAELNIDVADPHEWTKSKVRVIDALASAVADGLVSADGKEFVEGEDAGLKAVQAKFGKKDKKPFNEAVKLAAKWLGVKAERSFDANANRTDLVSFVLYENSETP